MKMNVMSVVVILSILILDPCLVRDFDCGASDESFLVFGFDICRCIFCSVLEHVFVMRS
jgi:hypothetical protein